MAQILKDLETYHKMEIFLGVFGKISEKERCSCGEDQKEERASVFGHISIESIAIFAEY